MERFDFIVPSGYFCVTGYHLRHARLHGETLPFDWLDGVTPELFAGFLESRFRDFLELPQLIPEGKKEEGDGHYRFRMPSGVVFVHDFARPDPAEEFAGVKQKYDRRIKRLFDKAAKARAYCSCIAAGKKPTRSACKIFTSVCRRCFPTKG